ncbi:MAG: hypothetical protein HY774_07285 [Acidobacteria bacterium]|nr:hypothetical protein [Acidobacteriota bacterium]
MSFQIFAQRPAQRCDVCHQSDCFDPITCRCSRCQPIIDQGMTSKVAVHRRQRPVSIPLPFRSDWFFQPYFPKSIKQKAFDPKPGLPWWKVVLPGLTLVEKLAFYLLLLALLPAWLVQQRVQNAITARAVLGQVLVMQDTACDLITFDNYTDNHLYYPVIQIQGCRHVNETPSEEINRKMGIYNGYRLIWKARKKTDSEPSSFTAVMVPLVQTGMFRTGDDCFYIDEYGVMRHSGSPAVIPNRLSPVCERDFSLFGSWFHPVRY